MKELKIETGELLLLDDEDIDRISKFKWYFLSRTVRRSYFLTTGTTVMVTVAQEILKNTTDLIDHKDRNPLNNQKENLRFCNTSQNAANRAKLEGTHSFYKGVAKDRKRNGDVRWRAYTKKDGIRINIGSFDSEEEAAGARDKKVLELFGEFAVLNFPTASV